MDPRETQLAELLLNHSLQAKEGDHVMISVSDFTALNLIRECQRLCLQRGAHVFIDVCGMSMYGSRADTGGFLEQFLAFAPDEQLETPPPLMKEKVEWADKFLLLNSIHNRNFMAGADAKRSAVWRSTYNKVFEPVFSKERVVTYYPTVGTAQNANMSLGEFTDYFFQAVLIDYAELSARIQAVQDILDAGSVVRIQANNTDLTLGIAGRLAAGAAAGRRNVPDGECFIAPLEHATEGVIAFELPQTKDGSEIKGIRLEFREGRVESFSAETGGETLQKAFDDNDNNRRLGELGIGMNRFIQKYIHDTLFDEKIYGTVHLALGSAYPYERGGGPNRGSIHWDLVKDLRSPGTLVTVDGRPLIKDGQVLA